MSLAMMFGHRGEVLVVFFHASHSWAGVRGRSGALAGERPGRDPICLVPMALISSATVAWCGATIFSKVFPKQLSREMGQ